MVARLARHPQANYRRLETVVPATSPSMKWRPDARLKAARRSGHRRPHLARQFRAVGIEQEVPRFIRDLCAGLGGPFP